jgi:hypothetical protein
VRASRSGTVLVVIGDSPGGSNGCAILTQAECGCLRAPPGQSSTRRTTMRRRDFNLGLVSRPADGGAAEAGDGAKRFHDADPKACAAVFRHSRKPMRSSLRSRTRKLRRGGARAYFIRT